MRIVIDMQGAQTESRFRGIGRYTMSLSQAIVRNRGEHEVILALNGLLPDGIQSIRETFAGHLPQTNIRVWDAPGPVRAVDPTNCRRREVAELIREAFLANLKPDVVFLPSLFEGFIDDAVTSIGRFDRATPVCATIHDLIPLLNPEHYLKPNPPYDNYYQRKVDFLRQASGLLAISESSRKEALVHLGMSQECVANTSEAADELFRPIEVPNDQVSILKAKFCCSKPFVLYTGGADERKNLQRLIRSFAALPNRLRTGHQLVLAGKIAEGELSQLRHQARSLGLSSDDVCFTGYVSDEELVQLYNLCKLFVFPSWHEGFGLPALEAMACGAAVIGAGTSSLPEVIGRADALFDPMDVADIATCMARVLEDDVFRAELRNHGLQQSAKFSWDETARRTIGALEGAIERRTMSAEAPPVSDHRPKLAFVSPLPPERSGISDYSAELLPVLARYYDIDVVVSQEEVSDPWVLANCRIRDVEWLRENSQAVDRVLYQMGNSPFHRHMLDLIQDIPGTVVLHDFYLSGLMAYLELHGGEGSVWAGGLYLAHGYGALRDRYSLEDPDETKRIFPVNFHVIQHAQGVIVHSYWARQLAGEWYPKDCSGDWEVIPLLRTSVEPMDRTSVRAGLGLDDDDFLICSFGFLDSTKLNHRLLEAWLESELARSQQCKLVFVGENHGGGYGAELLKTIRECGLAERITITGWADAPLFRRYLAAADIAVQLRTSSRGETSAAVLDCMNHGLPTVVNANGSMGELPDDAVWILPDNFDNAALIEALETLWRSADRRAEFRRKAREVIATRHSPETCARRYADAIEKFHRESLVALPALLHAIASTLGWQPKDEECVDLARALATNFPLKQPARQLLLDISATCCTDLKTGIERVARALTLALLKAPPAGFRVEPVYLDDTGGRWHYRYARRYTLGLLGCPQDLLVDEVVEAANGDVLVGLDLSGHRLVEAVESGLFAEYRNRGSKVFFMVHDLLPVQMPEMFPRGADATHANWLRAIAQCDGALCVSKAVADNLAKWVASEAPDRSGKFRIGWSHHGADFENSVPSTGIPENADTVLVEIRARPTFLMVGTIEPRKGYLQTLDAFSLLWQQDVDANLVIVGKEGWLGLPDEARRTIPDTVRLLRSHPMLGNRLFWLEGISDEYLERVYAASSCLIAASEGEGFGLPLIEAAQHKLPIIARDIPVFREVAGTHAFYFDASNGAEMADALKCWIERWGQQRIPTSEGMKFLSWMQSAKALIEFTTTD